VRQFSSADVLKDIRYLNSPGGRGLGIYDTMQYIKPDVATILARNGSLWERCCCVQFQENVLLLPHSRVMIHQPSGGAQGVATDMEINLREMLKLKDECNKLSLSTQDKLLIKSMR
jgi:ATP-dependent Clp protease protease subunit